MKVLQENITGFSWVYQEGENWIGNDNLGTCKAIEFTIEDVSYRAICTGCEFNQRTEAFCFKILYQIKFPSNKWRDIMPDSFGLEYTPKLSTNVNTNRYLNVVTGDKLFPAGIYDIKNGDSDCAFDEYGNIKENVISMTTYFNATLKAGLGVIIEKALFLEVTNS